MHIASSLRYSTVVGALWKQQGIARLLLLMVGGSLLLWGSAKLRVPFFPVPLTMQTYVVLVLGMAYGWRLAAATMMLYLLGGLAGLPLFAGTPQNGIGVAYLLGPTGGYLIGFVPAAMLSGRLAELGWDRSFPKSVVAMIAGTVVIYICGLFWLAAVIGWDQPILRLGLYPFVLGDLLKIGLAATTLPLVWRRIGTRFNDTNRGGQEK